jgi:hypothetical protein
MILNSRLMTQTGIAVGLGALLIKVVHTGLDDHPALLMPQPLVSVRMKRLYRAMPASLKSAPALSSGRV